MQVEKNVYIIYLHIDGCALLGRERPALQELAVPRGAREGVHRAAQRITQPVLRQAQLLHGLRGAFAGAEIARR